MTERLFPQRTAAQATGEQGITIFALLVQRELGWQFRRTPQESDFGIDGYIDIVTPEGYVTGKSLAVQIKTGASYFSEMSAGAWVYRGNVKHLNYYINAGLPVLLVLVHPDREAAWWRVFDAYETDRSGNDWIIGIPPRNEVTSASRHSLEALAGAATDYLPHLEHLWTLGDKVKDYGAVCVQVLRAEVESCNVRPFQRIFERLSLSREVALSATNKIDFLIDGYDEDPRELFQIPEVSKWIMEAVHAAKYLAFFLYLGPKAQGIDLIVSCVCDAHLVGPNRLQFRTPENLPAFLEQQFLWLNEFAEAHAMPEEVIYEASMRFHERIKQFVT